MRPRHLLQSGAVNAILRRESRISPTVAPAGLSKIDVWCNQTELVLRKRTFVICQGVRALKTVSNSAKDELSLLTFARIAAPCQKFNRRFATFFALRSRRIDPSAWASLTQVSMPRLQAANTAASLSRMGGLEADISSARLPIIQPVS